jgi:hypothetical protein
MKTWKHGIFGILAIIALAFIACDDGNGKNDLPEQPEFRETTITINFDDDTYSVKVQSTLLEAQWIGVADKIETVINEAITINSPSQIPSYGFANAWARNDLLNLLSAFGDDITIIVEKTSEYNIYKTIGNNITLCLNVDNVENLKELKERDGGITGVNLVPLFFNAINAMFNGRSEME